ADLDRVEQVAVHPGEDDPEAEREHRAPQRNQNSASGRMKRTTAGRSSAGIFGMVGVCVKLKYHRWPIHMMPLMMWPQRMNCVHQSKPMNSMAVFPRVTFSDGESMDRANHQDLDDHQHKARDH